MYRFAVSGNSQPTLFQMKSTILHSRRAMIQSQESTDAGEKERIGTKKGLRIKTKDLSNEGKSPLPRIYSPKILPLRSKKKGDNSKSTKRLINTIIPELQIKRLATPQTQLGMFKTQNSHRNNFPNHSGLLHVQQPLQAPQLNLALNCRPRLIPSGADNNPQTASASLAPPRVPFLEQMPTTSYAMTQNLILQAILFTQSKCSTAAGTA